MVRAMLSCRRRNRPDEENNDEGEEPVVEVPSVVVSRAVQTAIPLGMRWPQIVNSAMRFARMIARWQQIVRLANRLARLRRIWGVLGGHLGYIKRRGRLD